MSVEWVPVSEAEHGEPIELPTEEDGALLLSTVAAQFPRCSGLKYRAPAADGAGGGPLRGLRLADERLRPPPEGWAAYRYWCAFPRDPPPAPAPAPLPPQGARCSDLVVLGLPWKTGEEAVRDYFSAFGELAMVQVKRDANTGLSKGFGFVKFAEPEAQARALGRRHLIDGRWCDVRVPHGRGSAASGAAPPALRKVFVGRCTEALTAEDLRDHFAAFGRVTDVFVPRPFRAFGFVTFLEAEVAQSLCGQDHIIKGVSVNVSTASPKRERAAGVGWGLVEASRVPGWPGPHLQFADKPYLEYE